MSGKKISLVYSKENVYKPILVEVSKACNVLPSVLKADVVDETGEMLVVFDGDDEDVEKALAMLKEHGVGVTVI